MSEPGRSSRSPAARVRRAVGAAALTLALALVAAGCGGDPAVDPAAAGATPDPAAAATGTPVAGATDPATGAPITDPSATGATDPSLAGATDASGGLGATDDDQPGLNEIANVQNAGEGAIKISKLTPKVFAQAHCARPVVIVLHQPDSILDQELLASVNSAISRSSKKVQRDTLKLYFTPKQVKAYGDLMTKAKLLRSPGVAIINRGGAIQNVWDGYVDDALILKSLTIAAATKPCKVSNEDAGAAVADPSLGAAQPAAAAPVSSLANAASIANGTAPAATPDANAGAGSSTESSSLADKLTS